jgi:hypothetical protein
MTNNRDEARIKVRVLAIQRSRDVTDGKVIYQIAFGRIVDLTDEIKERIAQAGQTVPGGGTDISVPSLVVTAPFSTPPPYRLDSEWEITIGSDGSISLKEL